MKSRDPGPQRQVSGPSQSCMAQLQSVGFGLRDSEHFLQVWRNASMPKVKQASKRKRVTKAAPVLGAAGLTFSLVGGASAAAVPTQDVPVSYTHLRAHET